MLGPEHPHTLIAKGLLAVTLYKRGDLAGAEKLEREVLEARERVVGPEHPYTLGAKGNLAYTLKKRGAAALRGPILHFVRVTPWKLDGLKCN